LKPQLETYTKEKKLNIQWLGYVNPKQIEKEMNAAAMVIVPSLWNENCSMTIMESLASGRPVIASKSGGNQELINPGYNGFTFDAGDASQLTNRIGLLLKSNLNEFSRNAAQSGTNFFSTNCHLKHIIKTYRQFQEEGSLVDHRISRREPIQKLPSTQEI
jgi:glycosyltransferase involved in cell wall biosynthesis